MCKATYQGRPVEFFELVETTAIDDTGNHLAYIVAFAAIAWDDTVEVSEVIAWWLGWADIPGNILATIEIGDDAAADRQSMFIIEGIMIGDAGDTTMDIRTTQIFCTDLFTRRGLHQWRTGQENGAIASYNYRFIAHRGNICSSSGARTHYSRDLWNALAGHTRLVIENAPKVVTIRKDLCLEREECTAGVNEVDAG